MIPGPKASSNTPQAADPFFDDDDEGWQDMPVIHEDDGGLDDEDRKKFHYVTPQKQTATNATGDLIDFDDSGNEWREKAATNESEYTRLRLDEMNDSDEVHLRTKFLFDEDKAMTPLSQMQTTKNMLSEAQRIAYVGMCALVMKDMARPYKNKGKEFKTAVESLELWSLRIMGRLFYHMELETAEQKMIESLAEHGVEASDLAPSLMTTRTVANPEYDPVEGKKQEIARFEAEKVRIAKEEMEAEDIADDPTPKNSPTLPKTPITPSAPYQTTANVLPVNTQEPLPGVSTSLSAADKDVTLDVRWTILCDLFLILIADSVYDARSRVLLEQVAYKLGLGWLDVVRFEERVTEALEIQEGVERLEQKDVIESRVQSSKKRRYAMMGLATLGGGLVIGLSAGLLAPVIGAGLGAAFTTIGISGTSAFLGGTAGAAVITTAGTLTGSGIAARGMARRTKDVSTFEVLPLHNNKRVNCILTVSGFMTSSKDDVRLPFSVLDPVVGDVFSVLWEPQMLGETGSIFKILTSEVLSQVGQTVLQATVMTALMSALQWPILLTKLGYLIDNPWFNALDRARSAGLVLADVLKRRHLGVRPVTLIGFSLGARVIFYCLLELAKQKAYGIIQDVFILGATVTASKTAWCDAHSVVSGRFVNGYARNDWMLNYLFRASSAGLSNIAGLRPITDVPGLENVDVTDKIAGHMSYRSFMPLILDQLGFPVSADYFNEPEEPDMKGDREVVRETTPKQGRKSWFTRRDSKKDSSASKPPSRPPSALSKGPTSPRSSNEKAPTIPEEDDLPERLEFAQHSPISSSSETRSQPVSPRASSGSPDLNPDQVGFDFAAIHDVIAKSGGTAQADVEVLHAPLAKSPHAAMSLASAHEPSGRAESAPPPIPTEDVTDAVSAAPSRSRSHLQSTRARVTSTPYFGASSDFESDGFDEDAREISEGRGFVAPPPSGPDTLDVDRDLSRTFAHSVSLDSGAFAANRTVEQYPAWEQRDSGTSSLGYGSSLGTSGWSSGAASSSSAKLREPSLSFGGPGGGVWGTSTISNASVPSLSFAPTSSASSELPADILNPFAISSTNVALSGQDKSSDNWTPPPLTLKSATTGGSGMSNANGGLRGKRGASTVNLNANPWG